MTTQITPKKILEVKDANWLKGLSLQPDMPVGGLFQTATQFNPFERMGYFQGSLMATQIGAGTITTQINHITIEGDGYAYAIGDRSGTGAKSFYRIQLSNNAIVDYSTAIDQNASTGALTHNGLTIYGGPGESQRVIYEQGGSLRSNSLITPTAGNDLNILTSALSGGTLPIDFCVGSDLNLYYTANTGNSIGKIVTVLGTSGNTASIFALERGLNGHSITSDGYYLAIVADNNDSRLTTITGECKVYFWDKVKSTADVIWPINDIYLIGGRFVDGSVKILGYSGIWECNLHTPPKLVYPIYNKNILPTNVASIDVQGTSLVWAAGSTGAQIYAFGSDIGKPILYNPYQSSQSNDTHTALATVGNQLLAATTAPAVYIHNTGSTRASATIQNATQDLDGPYSFAYAKIVLKDPLSSGQSVILGLFDSNGRVVMNNTTKAYSVISNKKDIIFPASPTPGSITNFDDLYFSLTVGGGAIVKRLSIYGISGNEATQTL